MSESSENKLKKCYVCKKQFQCPCWQETCRLKFRCCAVGTVPYISQMYDTGQGIYHIHLCSKMCEQKLPEPMEKMKYQCPLCKSATYHKDGKEAAKKSFNCWEGKQCQNCKKKRCQVFKCGKCKDIEYCGKECQAADQPSHRNVSGKNGFAFKFS